MCVECVKKYLSRKRNLKIYVRYITNMTKAQRERMTFLDRKREALFYKAGELSDLCDWIQDGYREGVGRDSAVEILIKEVTKLKKEGTRIFDKLMSERKQMMDCSRNLTSH